MPVLLALLPGPVAAQELVTSHLQVPGGLQYLQVDEAGSPVAIARDGREFSVHIRRGTPVLFQLHGQLPNAMTRDQAPGLASGTDVATGTGTLAQAWLASGGPGDARSGKPDILVLQDRSGRETRVPAGAAAVFEPVTPVIVDLDRDGAEEVLAIRRMASGSASVVLLRQEDAGAQFLDAVEITNLAGTRVSIAGVHDFDRLGGVDIALVRENASAGELIFLSWDGAQLVETALADNVANRLAADDPRPLAAIGDINGDRLMDLVIPDAGRGALRIITLDADGLHELARVALGGRLASPVVVVKDGLFAARADGVILAATLRPY